MAGTNLGISAISTSSTTAGSVLNITTKGGAKSIDVSGITTDALKSINGPGVTLTGGLTSSGSIGAISLDSATGGTINGVSIGKFTVKGEFSDNLVLSGTSADLNTFKAGSITGGTWTVGGSANSISAASAATWSPTFGGAMKTVTIAGDANVVISAMSIGTFTVKGALNNSQIRLTGTGNDLNKLAIGGALSGSVINSAGSIGAITAAALINGEIYAGIASLSNGLALPSTVVDFASMSSIKSVRVKAGASGTTFSNSDIAAANLGVLSLGTLQTTGNANVTGIVGETIASLTATTNKKFVLKKLNATSDIAALLSNMGVMLGQIVVQAPGLG